MRNRKKMWIALALFVASLMVFRLALAMMPDEASTWMVIFSTVLLAAALVVFALYFRE
ncbi:hypothetical protein [Olivibacter sp. XZL3]|uniref:hypothetical protein n=1 Tax=Olivibacter sp. XZL3 TaxID=1735116 RepID=UPI001417032F|nr:hypothetical protein [Olivibacter sp. XZL3]